MRMVMAAMLTLIAARAAAPPAQIRNAGTPNAIVGRVTTPDGRPVSDAVVTLVEREVRHKQTIYHIADARAHVVTDAEGRYALEDARLGDFYVAAIPHNPQRGADGRANRAGYRITYYPSAPDPEHAMPVTVNIRERQVADIKLLPSGLAMITGVVLDSKEAAVPQASVHIAHGDHLFGIDGMNGSARADGTFGFAGFPPGTYFLQFRETKWPPARGENVLVSGAKVVVTNGDVTGVRVRPIHLVHAEGRLIAPAEFTARLPADLTVSTWPVNVDGNPGPHPPSHINEDLTFSLDSWPGLVWMRVLPEDTGWQITHVRYHGADVTDSGIDFKEGQPVLGIEIEIGRIR